MGFLRRSKPLVGLDIGSSAVKAVELTKSKKGYELTGFAYRATGTGRRRGRSNHGCSGRRGQHQEDFLAGKFKPKSCCDRCFRTFGDCQAGRRAGCNSRRSRSIDQLDAEQYIPFEIAEVNLDYQVVGPGITSVRRSREWKSFWSPRRKTRSRTTPT